VRRGEGERTKESAVRLPPGHAVAA
jgi:hypothetical protein